ncbi:sugar MFS transporter [Phenylobacterium sp.]|uniref:MFS transporter n=1 Tax=Phenylobacterium sp. TaxID=1871053 RepID=UPI00272FFE19|nr:MFS transporter [Phenylobacterium sp.]MDP1874776.1 MFS transporter [Phenylobacterium sp.]MDP3299379.1 MFS transporter [Phenylobacterium sp.]
MLVGFADEWFTFLPAGLLQDLREDAGLSYAQGGLVLAALSLGGVVGVVFQAAADYVSRRALSALGTLAYGGSMIAFGLADSFWPLFMAAFVWGAASDAFVHGCEVALVDVAGSDLPRALARVNAWSAAGDLLAPLTLVLAGAFGLGWRGPFLAGGVLMLGYGLWLARQPFPPPHARAHADAGRELLAVLTDGRVLMMAVMMGLFALLDEPLLAFLIAYLEDIAGHGPGMAVALSASALVGGLIGYGLAERLIPDDSPAAVLAPGALAMALSLPVLAFGAQAWMVVAGGLVFGFSGAVFYTALQSLVLTLRPGQAGSTGAVVSVIGLAGAAFPALVGRVADQWGLGAGLGLYVAVPALLLVLTLVLRRDA